MALRMRPARSYAHFVVFVRAVYPEGHETVPEEHLSYVAEMANRVGFTILEEQQRLGLKVHRIKLHVAMGNPYFIAELEDGRCGPVDVNRSQL